MEDSPVLLRHGGRDGLLRPCFRESPSRTSVLCRRFGLRRIRDIEASCGTLAMRSSTIYSIRFKTAYAARALGYREPKDFLAKPSTDAGNDGACLSRYSACQCSTLPEPGRFVIRVAGG